MKQADDPGRPAAREAQRDQTRAHGGGAPTGDGGDAGGAVDVVDAARVAAVFRVLSDASRCRLVYALLRHDEISVGELAATLSMTESNVSHHLSVLRAHGLVRFRREGKQVFYAPDDEHIRLLLDLTLVHVRHGDADLGSVAGGAAR